MIPIRTALLALACLSIWCGQEPVKAEGSFKKAAAVTTCDTTTRAFAAPGAGWHRRSRASVPFLLTGRTVSGRRQCARKFATTAVNRIALPGHQGAAGL